MFINISSAFIYSLIVVLIGLLSVYFNILTSDGFLAGMIIGIPIIVFGGPYWFILLLIFLISGGFLSRIGKDRKALFNKLNEKAGVRAWPNVIANGLWPMISSLLYPVYAHDSMGNLLILFYIGALNSMISDTTATEIGMLFGDNPKLITDMKKTVEKGASGGVTIIGFLSSLAAAITFSLISMYLLGFGDMGKFLISLTLAGVIGNLSDSLIGAVLQGKYKCPRCELIVETRKHCGVETIHLEGFRWIDNHNVNFIASFIGGVSAILIYVSFL